MKNARQLLEEFIATSFRDPKQAASMFTAGGTFEIPYLEDLSFQPKYRVRTRSAAFSSLSETSIPALSSRICGY